MIKPVNGKLDLCAQQLRHIPSEIFELTNLTELYLDNNQFTELPTEIAQLNQLRVLSLAGNQLTNLPKTISQLKQLEWLYLANNQFAELPTEIAQLSNLKVISLDNNQIKIMPETVTHLSNLKTISLYKNPLIFPPQEIAIRGSQEILNFLRAKKQPQWRAKLILVGNARAGKTSLLKALKNDSVTINEQPTHGIAVNNWSLKHPEKDVTMQLKTWDFGGQAIQHLTHQFFLTDQALFILVWDTNVGYIDGKLSYWLETIQAKAPHSRILLIATHIDDGFSANLPFKEFKRKYPQIVGRYEVDNLTGRNIDAVRQIISTQVAQLPRMGIGWPVRWLEATKAIDNLNKKYLSLKQLNNLMQQHGLSANEGDTLAIWLHELGELFYFRNDLKNFIILKPQWVTEHINRILTSKQIENQEGILNDSLKQELWNDLEPEMQTHFSNLMEEFDLSYRALEDRHTHFIPSLLPYESPDGYEETWDNRNKAKEIRMIYQLNKDFISEITTSFIARSHRFTTNTHWRYGALFADDTGSLALVKAFPEEQRLELAVRGISPYEFFTQLHSNLKYTLQRFPGLKIIYKKLCLGHKGQKCTHEFDYADIEIAVKEGRKTIPCPKKHEYISIYKLIYGIEDKAKAKYTICPMHFQLKRHKPKLWQKPFINSMIELHLCCEKDDNKHLTTENGCYYLPEMLSWINSIPFLLLFINFYLGSIGTILFNKDLKIELKFIKELLEKFPDETKINKIDEHDLTSFHELLKKLQPLQRWGLKQVRTKDGRILWLCEEHITPDIE